MMEKYHQRLKALFADIERLAEQPDADTAAMRRELQSLRARVIELEIQFLESEKRQSEKASDMPGSAPAVQSRLAPPILYEKEQVGYDYSGDKLLPLQIANLSGLDVVNALHVPLIETGQPVGSVYVEAPHDKKWTVDDANIAESVAQQVSLQIQNLRLLAAAERARSEAQAATRRFAHESWDAYLDAIQRSERIGYAFDQNAVVPFADDAPTDADIKATVEVLGEQVGNLYLKSSPATPITDAEREMVEAVARQVAQQVESIRLLADAARARAEAEEATRRISRTSWKEYADARQDATLAFMYDASVVVPLTEEPEDVKLTHELVVRGEPIGTLGVAGMEEIPPDAEQIIAAIATQASLQLEALRLTEELEKRAAELTELDRLKSSFLANMSHELRTPLNSILGFSDVMLEGIDGELTPFMENDLRLIQKNGQHLLHLINDVLDMAKIESGRMNLHPEKFKVHDLMDEVLSITSTLASEKNLALFIEPDSDHEIEITADATRIRQVVINLANNSIKFTEKGKISLRVDAVEGGEKVLITVRDTGIGIPEDHLETVFQEFAQVDTSTTRKVGGTGLGLPISRRLVEMHGGRMWAESSGINGEGSSFYVELPLVAQIQESVQAEPVTKMK